MKRFEDKMRAMILLAFFMPMSLYAAESASTLLKKAGDKITSAKNISAAFVISDPNEGKVKGKIEVSGNKFAVETPINTTVFDGKTQYTIDPDACEISVFTPTAEEVQHINPFAIVNGYEKAFSSKLLKSSEGIRRIELTPKQKNSSFKKVILDLNSATLLPSALQITMSDGGAVRIDITDIKTAVNIPASRFVINYGNYPGYEIIDLR